MGKDNDYLTPRQAGEIAGVFQTTIIYWIKKKGLRATRSPGGHYKIYKPDLLDFLNVHDIYNKNQNEENKIKISLVDDDEDTRLLLKEYLEDEYALTVFDSVENIIDKIISAEPDIILLDVKMPEKNGFEVIEELKVNRRTRSIPVIFISALTESEYAIKGLQLQAEDYIRKPFDPEEIKLKIDRILRRS
jgi:excisionase family DNA binding protein